MTRPPSNHKAYKGGHIMTMLTQVNKVCKTASFHLYKIRRIRKYLTSKATRSLVHTIIVDGIDYFNSLLFNTPAIHICKLPCIQNCTPR